MRATEVRVERLQGSPPHLSIVEGESGRAGHAAPSSELMPGVPGSLPWYACFGARVTRSSFSAIGAACGGAALLLFLPALEDESPCAGAGVAGLLWHEILA